MEKNSKIIVVALVAALAVVSASLAAALGTLMTVSSSDIDTEVLSPPPANSTSFLFVQHASSGTIEPENDASTDAIYKLTLNGVYNNTISFSDRPDRTVDQITTARYVHLWTKGQDSFAADPPNAALVMNVEDDSGEEIFVVELLNPVYDAGKQTLVYDVVALNPNEGMLSFRDGSNGDATLPSSFGQASLFIDNAMDSKCTPNPGSDLYGCNFSSYGGWIFDLSYSNVANAYLNSTNLWHADMQYVDLTGSALEDADLTGANLTGAKGDGASFALADLTDADLTGTKFTNSFNYRANLNHADLTYADFSGADFTDADMTGAFIWHADLTGANLTGANLVNATILAILKDANFTGANLTGAFYDNPYLEGPIFCQTTMPDGSLNNSGCQT